MPFLAQRFNTGHKKTTAGKFLWWSSFRGYSVVHDKFITECGIMSVPLQSHFGLIFFAAHLPRL